MRRSRFTEFRIVAILKEIEGGQPVVLVCREQGVSERTCRIWQSKYGGMNAAELRRQREADEEDAVLKRMHALLAQEVNALKDVIERRL